MASVAPLASIGSLESGTQESKAEESETPEPQTYKAWLAPLGRSEIKIILTSVLKMLRHQEVDELFISVRSRGI